MKRTISIILALVMIMGLVACGNAPANEPSGNGAAEGSTYVKPERSFDGKVVYGVDLSNPQNYEPRTDLDFGEYSAENPLVLKAASQGAKDTDMVCLTMQWFCANLEDATGGAIKCDIYTDKQMGSDKEILDNINMGTLDIGTNNCSAMSSFDPMYGLSDVAYLFEDWDHVYNFIDSEYAKEYSAILGDKTDTMCLSLGAIGFRCFSNTKHPVYSAEDCAGLIVRVPQTENMRAFQALNSNPTNIAAGEVTAALQAGTVEASDNTPLVIYNSGDWEYLPYFSVIEYCTQLFGITFNEARFNSLTPDLQNLIKEIAVQTIMDGTKMAQQRQSVYVDLLAEKVELVPADQIDKQSFVDMLTKNGYYDLCYETYGKEAFEAIAALAD